MHLTFCTLFNSNYLDKGLTMYESLENVSKDFTLYILAMDNQCYEVLIALNKQHLIPIKLADFENEELLAIKSQRSVAEYCWTCSSSLIEYILNVFQPDFCTYIDADLYFYSDPSIIIKEMYDNNASVQIIGHRFNKFEEAERVYTVGKYCVEFNTFKNDLKGRKLLHIWKKQCLNHCSLDGDGIHWGDQKYMDNWPSNYEYVYETQNKGAGVAPWNINQYKYIEKSPNNQFLIRFQEQIIPLVFYHFENIKYINKETININIYHYWGIDQALVKQLYLPYLQHINRTKDMLYHNFNINTLIKIHPGNKEQIKVPIKKKLRNIIKILKSRQELNIRFLRILPSKLLAKRNIVNICTK